MKSKRKNARNRWLLLGALIVIIAAAFGWQRLRPTAPVTAQSGETAVASIGNLAESASAAGRVIAGQTARLSLTGSGVVDQVNVTVGDTVTAGDALVQLETAVLERNVGHAAAGVIIAQANLDNLQAPATTAALTSAAAAVASAEVALDDLLAGPTVDEIAASEASVAAARANLWSANGNLTAVYDVDEGDILAAQNALEDALDQLDAARAFWVLVADCEPNDQGTHTCVASEGDAMDQANQNIALAEAQVTQARARLNELQTPDGNAIASSQASVASAAAQYDAAVARHEALLAPSTEAEIAAAEADIANALATQTALLAGPSATNIDMMITRLAQAETSLREAELALSQATLVAPFDGIITAVHVSPGEVAGGIVIEMMNPATLAVELTVGEVDIGRITLGQPATISLETWPDEAIDATVTAIAPSAASGGEIVTYAVELSLGATALPVRVGMTANANLITANRTEILLVPNAAITADRSAGTYSVNRVESDGEGVETITVVPVTIGLRDDAFTEITGGLAEGDTVALGELSIPVDNGGFGPPGS